MSRAKRTPLSAQDKTQWREKVREECMQRVKQHRQSVLWRMRQEGKGVQEADVQSVLAGIIADVSCSSQSPPEAASSAAGVGAPAAMQHDEDDWLEQPSTPLPANAQPSSWLSRRELPGGNIMDEAFRLDEAEYLKLMSEMEQSFLAALLQDEAAFLTRLEAEDARDLDSLVAMHEEMPCSSDGVQCPICCRHCLVERNGVVLCPSGDLRLDLRNESLSLEHVRQLLADVLGSHSLQGCPGRPSFGMDSLILGAPPALVMRCSSCSSVQVVV
ncbi:hypothetical protein CVIRNUC_010013 [Coccomyxa viridis]|uniref:RPA-interacting protein C-terminal domain-containing protein n=1 Tax=Coccomyxa viridis TaxID=1274662 RepID=A0AAV1ILH6_9CHLO|nr:hypothetical protein CVIRNUC_010013 [Coccomyxa viridis]